MILAERLILYVIQKIRDEEAFVSRTKLLKVIYLIDVEYFRRHRKTLTGWDWVFHYYGPYVHTFPQVLDKLSLSDLSETEELIEGGRRIYGYEVDEDQDIDDLVSFADRVMIDDIIRRWSLEDLNLLLNHVYFETEPMIDAARGQPLDFNKIPRPTPHPYIDTSKLAIPKETLDRLRAQLEQARKKYEEQATRTASFLATHPVRPDASYRDCMEKRDRAEMRDLPEGLRVTMEPDEEESANE